MEIDSSDRAIKILNRTLPAQFGLYRTVSDKTARISAGVDIGAVIQLYPNNIIVPSA